MMMTNKLWALKVTFRQLTALVPSCAAALLLGAAPLALQAQVRPAVTRSVDEPARVPYAYSVTPTCPFTNQCTANFPVVPAGKRLRVNQVSMIFFFSNGAGFFMVHRNTGNEALSAWPVTAFGGAYYGALFSSTQAVDLIYEAGEAPVLEFGQNAGNTIFADTRNRFGVTGYIVDTTP